MRGTAYRTPVTTNLVRLKPDIVNLNPQPLKSIHRMGNARIRTPYVTLEKALSPPTPPPTPQSVTLNLCLLRFSILFSQAVSDFKLDGDGVLPPKDAEAGSKGAEGCRVWGLTFRFWAPGLRRGAHCLSWIVGIRLPEQPPSKVLPNPPATLK